MAVALDQNIYIGEAYIKREESIDLDFKTEHLRARRDLYVKQVPFFKFSQENKESAHTWATCLDKYSWRDPNTKSSKNALKFTKSIVKDIIEHVKVNWEGIGHFPSHLIESGSFFSNLRVGLPYEFDFMIDLTCLLSQPYTAESVPQLQARHFFSYEENPMDNIPNLKENIYYHIKTNISNNVLNAERCSMFNVKSFCEKLYTKFGEAVEYLKMKYDFFDYSTTKASPAFSFSVFYERTGILVDLVPCFKFPDSQKHVLPKVNPKMNEYLTRIAAKDESRKWNSSDHVYDMLPLYLVCYDTEVENELRDFTFRLSTSLFEKFFYKHLDAEILSALRVFRYLYQTFPSTKGELNGVWQKADSSSQESLHSRFKKLFQNTQSTIEGSSSKIRTKKAEQVFGCKNTISSYFFTNYILKLLTTGELIKRCKGKSNEEIFILFNSFKLELLQTIPADFVLPDIKGFTDVTYHISVGSWFFEDRSFACKTIALTEDQIFGLQSWLGAVRYLFLEPFTTGIIDKLLPLTCIVPQVKCDSCKRHETFETAVKEFNVFGKNHCYIHQLVGAYLCGGCDLPMAYCFEESLFFANELAEKGLTIKKL